MVDQGLKPTNRSILHDHIEFLVKPYKQKPSTYRDLYEKEGLSAAQIAERLGCSKTTVLEHLRRLGAKFHPSGTTRFQMLGTMRFHESGTTQFHVSGTT